MNLRPLGPEPGVGFADEVAPERKGSDSMDISGAAGGSNPRDGTPYEAEQAPDRAAIGRGADRLLLPERLLTIRDVAARLGVCRATAYAMVERGELPVVRIGSAVRVHPADLQALVVRRRG